ncbi:MAG: 4Fe-4S binding protein [Candidatus Latescibacteria bacterium]|nr:4Fe-4S binding protein [Candidatus Latescibacterota bacterium]
MKRLRSFKAHLRPLLLFAGLTMLPGVAFAGGEGPEIWTAEFIAYAVLLLVTPALLFFKWSRRVRWIIMLGSLAYFGFLQSACPSPMGAIELALIHLRDETPILRHLLKIGLVLIPALLFGRYFCGWICPKGIIQDYLYRPNLVGKVPEKVDRALKYGKYGVLALLILLPLIWRVRFFRAVGPFKVIFNLDGTMSLLIFLGVVLVASIFVSRPFCRYLCPLGALLALIARISPFKMRILYRCTACGLCMKACPVDAIRKTPEGMRIEESECIACKECEGSCRKNGCAFGGAASSRSTDQKGENPL